MTKFRKACYGSPPSEVWTVEYCPYEDCDDDSGWFDLFEDPSETVCAIVVEALQKVNPEVVTGE